MGHDGWVELAAGETDRATALRALRDALGLPAYAADVLQRIAASEPAWETP